MKKTKLKRVLIVVSVIIGIIMIPMIYRWVIIFTNEDIVIYEHENDKFKFNVVTEINSTDMLDIEIYRPVWVEGLKEDFGDARPLDIQYISVNLSKHISLPKQKLVQTLGFDVSKYNIKKCYLNDSFSYDNFLKVATSRTELYTTVDGSQFIIYKKYNRLYLHMVDNS